MATHRRRVLRLCGIAGIGAIAGCSGGSQDDSGDPGDDSGDPGDDSDDSGDTETPAGSDAATQGGSDLSRSQVAKLTADDGGEQDEFGWSVALSSDGTTALIGAGFDDTYNGDFAGSAYVFDSSGESWSQQAKLLAEDGDGSDNFGWSVALSADGTVALVGAVGDEGDGYGDTPEGSAYVFEDSGRFWTQQAKLTAEDTADEDKFGESVALSADGTTALIGAGDDANANGDFAGSTYVFDSAGGSWNQQAKLIVDDGGRADHFGASVSISDDGTTALISAAGDANDEAAYVYDSAAGSWIQQAKLAANDGRRNETFGSSVALAGDGTTALVGTEGNATRGDSGSAYVFTGASGSWSQQAKFSADDSEPSDYFGTSVAVSNDGTAALIGAISATTPNGEGSAYVFENTAGSWSQEAKLAAADTDGDDNFGDAVAMSSDGTTGLIGAYEDEEPNGFAAGSAYVFDL